MARAFLERWVAQYGCPAVETTDRGSHFEGAFDLLLRSIGCTHARTTAYHPASNGLIERFHRQLKAALRAHANPSWQETLPLVLLGIRSTVKYDLGTSAADMLYGCSLRLPGEMISPKPASHFDYGSYIHRLHSYMRQLKPAASREQHSDVYLPTSLDTASHVFVRNEAARHSLQAPYTGPFRVVRRTDKTFTIDRQGHNEVVSLDRLKPAYVECPLTSAPSTSASDIARVNTPQASASSTAPSTMPAIVTTNRRGRTVRQPVRFADFVETF